MSPNQTKAVATRLPAEKAALLEQVVNDHDVTTAAVVRRSITYYIETNPDKIRAFYPDDSLAAFVEELY